MQRILLSEGASVTFTPDNNRILFIVAYFTANLLLIQYGIYKYIHLLFILVFRILLLIYFPLR